MLGFGKLKFIGSRIFGTDACYVHCVSLPLPTPLGWWAHLNVPFPLWIGALAVMFVVEVLVPFLFFATGAWRVGAGVATVALQLGIQATGNFGHFNVLTAVLCIPMLDADSSALDTNWHWGWIRGGTAFSGWAPGAVVALYVVLRHMRCRTFPSTLGAPLRVSPGL